MKTAFVHDWIVHEWWAEAVLRDLIQKTNYTQATLFVLYSTMNSFVVWEKNIGQMSELHTIHIVTALPQRLNNIFIFCSKNRIPVISKIFDYRNLMFWFPLLCMLLRKKIKKYNPENIVIDSFAAVKNIVVPERENQGRGKNHNNNNTTSNHSEQTNHHKKNNPTTTLYLHSPMQYIWENYNENIKKLSFPIKQLYQFAASYLRPWDVLPRRYDVVLCNSNYTAELAKQLYKLDGQVAYPIIHKAFFEEPIVDNPKPYYIYVGRVQRYVREIDKVIELCNTTHTPLIVMGDGPDMVYAQSIAWPTIIFVGNISDVNEKINLMKHASGLINLAKESFGMTTAEALCLWLPVFGYNGGATPELVQSQDSDNKNWYLVSDKNSNILENEFATYIGMIFDRHSIATSARKRFGK